MEKLWTQIMEKIGDTDNGEAGYTGSGEDEEHR